MADGYDGEVKLRVVLTPGDIKKAAMELQKEIQGILSSGLTDQLNKSFTDLKIKMDEVKANADALNATLSDVKSATVTSTATAVSEVGQEAQNAADSVTQMNNALDNTSGVSGISETVGELTELQQATKEVLDQGIGDNVSKDMARLLDNMQKVYDQSVDVSNQMKELENSKVPTDQYAQLQGELEKVRKKYDSVMERSQKFDDMGGKVGSKQWESLQYDLEKYETKLIEISDKMREMEEGGTAFIAGSDTGAYDDLAKKGEALNNWMRVYLDQARQIKNAPEPDPIPEDVVDSYKSFKEVLLGIPGQIAQAFSGTAKAAVGGVVNFIRELPSMALTAARGMGTLLNKVRQLAGSAIRRGIEKLRSTIKSMGKDAGGSNVNVGKLLRTLIRYTFGVRSFYFLFNRLRTAIKEGFKELAQYNDGNNATNTAISNLISSLDYLKRSWAAAFAPILQVVEPILTSLMDKLSRLAEIIGSVMAFLSRQSTFTKAIKVQKNYADSLKKTGDSAKEAGKSLASFDKLNNKTTTSDSGSGSGTNPNDLFEEVPVDSILPDFVKNWFDKLKEAWRNGDWYGIGRIIAQGLNSAMKLVDDWINNVFRPLGVEWAHRIAQILNGFVDNLDWELLGKTIADGLNALADIFNTFLTEFDFENLGKGIGRAIYSWFDNIEWDLIGQLFANKYNAFINFIYGIVTTPELWEKMGESLAEFWNNLWDTLNLEKGAETIAIGINGVFKTLDTFVNDNRWEEHATKLGESVNKLFLGIKWEEIGGTFANSLNGVFLWLDTAITTIDWTNIGKKLSDGLLKFITDTDWAKIGKTLYDFFNGALNMLLSVDWVALATSLGNALGEMIGNINWVLLIDKLSTLFIELVFAAFSALVEFIATLVDSLADAFDDLGLNGIAGFFRGISDGLRDLNTWIKQNIFDPFINALKSFFGIHSPSTVMAGIGEQLILGLKKGIVDAWHYVTDAIKEKWDSLMDWINGKIDAIKQAGANLSSGLKSGISSAWNSATNAAADMANNVIEVTQNAFKISSPSKVFAKIGRYLVQGLAQGIDSESNKAIKTAENLSDDVSAATAGTDIVFSLENVIIGLDGVINRLSTIATIFNQISESLVALDSIPIPAIVSGSIIPANAPTASDTDDGEDTEYQIETAVFRAIRRAYEAGYLDSGEVQVDLDGYTLARVVRQQNNIFKKSTGGSLFES